MYPAGRGYCKQSLDRRGELVSVLTLGVPQQFPYDLRGILLRDRFYVTGYES